MGVAGHLNMAMVTMLYRLGIEMKLISREKVCIPFQSVVFKCTHRIKLFARIVYSHFVLMQDFIYIVSIVCGCFQLK